MSIPLNITRFGRQSFANMELPYGMFGENFTTEGLDEESVHIGDQFRIGEAVVEVTQPRMPCYKLGIRFSRPDMPKRFHCERSLRFLSGRPARR